VGEIWEQITTACLGVEDHVSDLQTKSGVKDQTAQDIIIELIRRGRELKAHYKKSGDTATDDVMVQEQSKWLQTQPSKPFNVLLQMHGMAGFICLILHSLFF
jgi:hypothetical protein